LNKLVSPQGLSATIINMSPLVNERHISFAKTTDNDLNENTHTAIVINDDAGGGVGIGDGNTTSGF
jgi:hypothetical protein